jgi:NitT/TauT family transport system ATP-binding protein
MIRTGDTGSASSGSENCRPHDRLPPVVVSADGLTKTYGKGDRAVKAIESVSFEVRARELVCIIGPSGAGKTTLLKCLAGLLGVTGGRLELEGRPIQGPPAKMALVFQDYARSLMPWLSVTRNVALPLRGKGIPKQEIKRRTEEMLEAVGLGHAVGRYPWQLSGGMQQRVAIARALAYRPDVLLMDEPFASVDAQTRMDLEDLVLRLREQFEITVMFVTHDIDESIYLSDRIIVLSPSPTTIRGIIPVDLPNPRDQSDTKAHPRFAEIRRELIAILHGRPGPSGPADRGEEEAGKAEKAKTAKQRC